MATLEIRAERAGVWLPANPWLWMGAGLLASLTSFVWLSLWGDQGTPARLMLVVAAILSAGVAVALQLNSSHRAFLDEIRPGARSLVMGGLFVLHGALTVFAVLLLLVSLLQRSPNWTGILLLNVIFVPVGGCVAWLCLDRCKTKKSLGRSGESATLLTLAGMCVYVCYWALYLGDDRPLEWDSMRLFLGVLATVAVLGGGLMLLTRMVRRIVISVLVVMHFGGILSAVMNPPPNPFVFGQLWHYFYRPYLEFMFLNNAYHFYSPDPGPSTFLWFHVDYVNPEDGMHISRWVEAPQLREDGSPDYPTALNYQRRLAMTDHVMQWETTLLQPQVITSEGELVWNPTWYWRIVYSGQEITEPPVPRGKIPNLPAKDRQVPFHPNLTWKDQYNLPRTYAKLNMEAFARHVYSRPHPEKPQYKAVSVQAYRVVHILPSSDMIRDRLSPINLVLYRPYYMGKFGMDENGKFGLLDEPAFDNQGQLIKGDPLLYWLMPCLPEDKNLDTMSVNQVRIKVYAYRHGGNEDWVWNQIKGALEKE
jgi:hypothetical protein